MSIKTDLLLNVEKRIYPYNHYFLMRVYFKLAGNSNDQKHFYFSDHSPIS